MTYVEIDLEDELYEELRTLAEEEGVGVEELIVDILKDEFALPHDEEADDDLDDDDVLESDPLTYDDEN